MCFFIFILWWDFWIKFALLTIFMVADVYLVMCLNNFKLASMSRTLHSLPVGAHFLESVFVTYIRTYIYTYTDTYIHTYIHTYIKYYCINTIKMHTAPHCSDHRFWLLPKYVTYYGHWVFSLQSRSEQWLSIWWHCITMLLRHGPVFVFSCLQCISQMAHILSVRYAVHWHAQFP